MPDKYRHLFARRAAPLCGGKAYIVPKSFSPKTSHPLSPKYLEILSFDTTVRRRPDRSRPPQVGPTGHTCTESAARIAHAKRPPRSPSLSEPPPIFGNSPCLPASARRGRSRRRNQGGPGGIISPGRPGAAPRGLRLVTLPLNPAFPDAFPPGGAGVREGCNLCFLSLYFAVSKSTSSVRGGFEKGAAPGRFSAAARQGFGVGLRVRAGRRSEESAQSARRQLFSNQVKEGMRT